MLDVGTIENVQREGLSSIEEARGIRDHAEMGRTNDEIGEIFGGKSASWVSNRKRLTTLPTYVQEHVHEGEISVRQAMALAFAESVWEEAQEVFEHPTKINHDLKLGTMVTQAKEDGLPSGHIRDRARELADLVERVEEAGDDFSPDVGTTHPDARSTARTDTDTTPETDEQGQAPENQSSQESQQDSAEGPSSKSGDGGRDRDDGRRPQGANESAEEAEGGDEDALDTELPAAPAGAEGEVSGDGAPPSAQPDEETPENWPAIRSAAIRGLHNSLHGNGLARDIAFQLGPEWVHGKPKAFATWYVDNVKIPEGRDSDEPVLDWIQAWAELRGFADRLPEPQWEGDSSDVGHVDQEEVSALLSCEDPESMWDDDAASSASIASLLVAHRVAGQRQETWRTQLIAEEVQERAGTITEEEVPDDVLADVEAEVERRLTPQGV